MDKVESEPSDLDDSEDFTGPKSKSRKPKPKKGKKPKPGDKESDVPSDDPDKGLKDKKRPRKKRPTHPSKHGKDDISEDVSVIIIPHLDFIS